MYFPFDRWQHFAEPNFGSNQFKNYIKHETWVYVLKIIYNIDHKIIALPKKKKKNSSEFIAKDISWNLCWHDCYSPPRPPKKRKKGFHMDVTKMIKKQNKKHSTNKSEDGGTKYSKYRIFPLYCPHIDPNRGDYIDRRYGRIYNKWGKEREHEYIWITKADDEIAAGLEHCFEWKPAPDIMVSCNRIQSHPPSALLMERTHQKKVPNLTWLERENERDGSENWRE